MTQPPDPATPRPPLAWTPIGPHAAALSDGGEDRHGVVINHRWTVAAIWRSPFARAEFPDEAQARQQVEAWAAAHGHPVAPFPTPL